VEGSTKVFVPDTEREAFVKAMENVTKGEFVMAVWRFSNSQCGYFLPYWLMTIMSSPPVKWEASEGLLAVAEVSLDSLDWVLKDGAFLQPLNRKTDRALIGMREKLPLWEEVQTVEDLEKGIGNFKWQFMKFVPVVDE
jgi:hypothetical protein